MKQNIDERKHFISRISTQYTLKQIVNLVKQFVNDIMHE